MKARKLKNAYMRKLRSDRIRSKRIDGRHDRWQDPEIYCFRLKGYFQLSYEPVLVATVTI